jgi:hypothetical protein
MGSSFPQVPEAGGVQSRVEGVPHVVVEQAAADRR